MDEVGSVAKLALDDSSISLWPKDGWRSFPGTCQVERVVRCWRRSQDVINWERNLRGFHGNVAIDGSLRGIVGMCAACGRSIVQMDGGGDEPVDFEVQRTIERAEIWALCMAFCGPTELADIHTDSPGVAQAPQKEASQLHFGQTEGCRLVVVRLKTDRSLGA